SNGGSNGVLYASGFTNSSNFPTTPGVLQGTYGGGADDGFVAEFQIFSPIACTTTFTGGGGTSDWGTPMNWSTGLLPDTSDNACLGGNNVTLSAPLPWGNRSVSSITATGGTLTLSGGSLSLLNSIGVVSSINNLTVSGGTLVAGENLTINGAVNFSSGTITNQSTAPSPVTIGVTGMTTWSGGTISGAVSGTGAPIGSLVANGGLAITGTPQLNQAALLNCGSGTLSGPTTVLTLTGGAAFQNGNGVTCGAGTMDLMDSGGLAGASGSAGAGTWNKSLAGTSTIAPLFSLNPGTVNVTNGTLAFDQILSTTGSWNVSTGATLELAGEADFNPGSSISGAGTMDFSSSGNAPILEGTYNLTGFTNFTGSSGANIEGTITDLGAITMDAGTVSIGSTLISSAVGTIVSINQTGGTLFIGTGTGPFASLGPMTVSGGTLQLAPAAATTSPSLSVSNTGTVAQILAGSTLNLTTLTVTGGALAGSGTINVSGPFTWSGGTLGTGMPGGTGGTLNLGNLSTSMLSGSLNGISGLVITNS